MRKYLLRFGEIVEFFIYAAIGCFAVSAIAFILKIYWTIIEFIFRLW